MVTISFHKGTDFCCVKQLTLSDHVSMESHGNAQGSVGCVRVVGIAIVVDIGKVGRVATIRRTKPPVGAYTDDYRLYVNPRLQGLTLCICRAMLSAM